MEKCHTASKNEVLVPKKNLLAAYLRDWRKASLPETALLVGQLRLLGVVKGER